MQNLLEGEVPLPGQAIDSFLAAGSRVSTSISTTASWYCSSEEEEDGDRDAWFVLKESSWGNVSRRDNP